MADSPLKTSPIEKGPTLEYPPRRGWMDAVRDAMPSAEQVSNVSKTLIWVIPLTLLIWVYAEREETVKVTLPPFPVVVKTTAPDRMVELLFPQDQNIVVEISGPRANVDHVREQLSGKPLELVIDPQLGLGTSRLSAAPLLNNHPLFTSNGITVKACLPVTFSVDIDQFETRDAIVKAQPEAAGVIEYGSYQPDRVRIRAPSRLFASAPVDPETKELFVTAKFMGRSELRTRTGKLDLENVPIAWQHAKNVTLSSPTVSASLTLKQGEEKFVVGSVPIFKQTPLNFERTTRVEYEAIVSNVPVIGPKDLIEMIRKNERSVTARLIVKNGAPSDLPYTGELRFDLPPGVRLADDFRRSTWEYKLVDAKSGG